MNGIVLMSELMHDDVQEHESPELRFGETAGDATVQPVMRKGKTLENALMRVEVSRLEVNPEVIPPGVEENRTGFLPPVELIETVTVIPMDRQHDTPQVFGEPRILASDSAFTATDFGRVVHAETIARAITEFSRSVF